MKVELLPRKAFELHTDGGVVSGQFSTWALSRYCDKFGLTLQQLPERLASGVRIADMIQFILCSVEYKYRRDKVEFTFTDLDAADWIDQMGGVNGADTLRLIDHFNSEGGEDEKKSQSAGQTSSATPPAQG